MEKYFGNAYRGDPGSERMNRIRRVLCAHLVQYLWQLSNQFKNSPPRSSHLYYILLHWHDKAMLFEQYHWKKAMAKKQPYKFKWNEYMDRDCRDSYYHNWPIYFP